MKLGSLALCVSTPDETALWISDEFNSRLHIFNATAMPPKPITNIPVRDQPGWITFSIDGRRVSQVVKA